MEYGLIGEHLPHSFSKEIHEKIADYAYELCELTPEELDAFMSSCDFKGINITIPYKQAVIPYLHSVDPFAREIGAVNTVINRGGKLYGYNTDFYGLCALIKRVRASLDGLHVLILGTGGTSRTAQAAAKALGASRVTVAGRQKKQGVLSYGEAYEIGTDIGFIINTTPCGMFPFPDGNENTPGCAVDISRFSSLCGVVDAVYNPLRTNLVLNALERGVKAEGGLYMLVSQAVKASELFCDSEYPEGMTDEVFWDISKGKESIILTGMPGSGKSTIGRLLAWCTGRAFVDTDDLIVEDAGMPITEIFNTYGEKHFRDLESAAVKKAANMTGAVIATGGGVILRCENVRALKRSGKIFFLNRPLSQIVPTSDRPLSSDEAALKRRFVERFPIYSATCDFKIDTDGIAEHTAKTILDLFGFGSSQN